MNEFVHALLARFTGSPLPETLPPVSPQTVTQARTSAADEGRTTDVGPATLSRATPALLARRTVAQAPAAVEGESPAVTALRLEAQQLRLLRTSAGARELAARLSRSESARAALDQRVLDLQAANESLTAERKDMATRLREAEDALAVLELGPRP